MRKLEKLLDLRTQVRQWRELGQTIAFVPTMGNLHDGHLSLVSKAKTLADRVVVSIFVNPLQFNDKSDLAAYPRTLAEDERRLAESHCDLLFAPSEQEMYPNGMQPHTQVHVPNMDDKLCGLGRPGHFDGVATVVTKLLNMVNADVAVFGEKDYQQLLLIKTMVKDLAVPTQIVGAPTLREANGLAMSSRNQYLTEAEREQAALLYKTLTDIHDRVIAGEKDFTQLQSRAIERLNQAGFETEYFEIRRSADLELAKPIEDIQLHILVAARLGKARLIDNIACNLA
jgi:pantoate--beta-alanine ligase